VGYHVSLLVLDEGARIPDEIYYACRPTIKVKKGRLVTLSTPFGRRGWFYHEWEWVDDRGRDLTVRDPWKKVKVVYGGGRPSAKETGKRVLFAQASRPDPEEAEAERARGHLYFAQEYQVQFTSTSESVFLQEQIDAAFAHDFGPLEFFKRRAEQKEAQRRSGRIECPVGDFEPLPVFADRARKGPFR
jgi:hypothetical protein